MKCVKIKSEKEFVVDKMDMPVSHNGSVVIKVKSCGICGSDIHYWVSGNPKGLVMGHEFAGDVVDPGERKDLKVGDRVTGLPISPCGKCEACLNNNPQYCVHTWSKAVGLSLDNSGGYAEYISCRGDMVRKIPDNVSYDEASMVEPTAVSYHALSLANIRVGDKVLVIGGGIIGLMALEFAKLKGALYTAVLETNELRGKKATRVGKADEYFDANDPNVLAKIKEKVGSFDVVIECCGNTPAVTEAIMCVKNGGTIVLVGVSLTPVTVPLVVSVMGEVTIKGAIAYKREDFDKCIELIDQGIIDVSKYIDDKVGLEDTQKSFVRLTSGIDDAVKIILKPEL